MKGEQVSLTWPRPADPEVADDRHLCIVQFIMLDHDSASPGIHITAAHVASKNMLRPGCVGADVITRKYNILPPAETTCGSAPVSPAFRLKTIPRTTTLLPMTWKGTLSIPDSSSSISGPYGLRSPWFPPGCHRQRGFHFPGDVCRKKYNPHTRGGFLESIRRRVFLIAGLSIRNAEGNSCAG
jgi:hypothetical protein